MRATDDVSGAGAAATPDELRRLVAEVLAEVLPGLGHRAAQTAPVPEPVPGERAGDPPAESTSARLAAALAARPSAVPRPARGAGGVPDGVPSGSRSGWPPRVAAPPAAPPGAPSGGPPRVAAPAAGQPAAPEASPDSWTVRLSNDTELAEFVLRVLKLADNPKLRRDLISGRIRFTLAGQSAGPAVLAVHRVDKGAVTERTVAAAASAGARLVLGRRAVLTPLGRDRARALRVPIEKER